MRPGRGHPFLIFFRHLENVRLHLPFQLPRRSMLPACSICGSSSSAAIPIAAANQTMGRKRPSFCAMGHPCTWDADHGRYSISERGRCWTCGHQTAAMIRGGKCSGRSPSYAGQNAHRTSAPKLVAAPLLLGESVLLVEVWAGAQSRLSNEAKKLGCYVLRIARIPPSKSRCDAPMLTPGVPSTWLLDCDKEPDRRLLLQWLSTVRQIYRVQRVAIVTSPPCTMHCSLQYMNLSRWAALPPSRRAIAMRKFNTRRLQARRAILFARALHDAVRHSFVGETIHVHEQPSKARQLVPCGDHYRSGEWPWAISADSLRIDVACCAVGRYGPRKDAIGKKWRFEMEGPTEHLSSAMSKLVCTCKQPHVSTKGNPALSDSAYYPRSLAVILLRGMLAR